MNLIKVKRVLKKFPPVAVAARKLRRELMPSPEMNVPEITPLGFREDENASFRLNFMTPSVDVAHVFGGISTAMQLFEALRGDLGCDARIICTDADVIPETSTAPDGYEIVSCDQSSGAKLQLVAFNDRVGKTLPIRKNDIFVCTAWWTAYTVQPIMDWQKEKWGSNNPLVYVVQDYEPGFYPWSSRYMMAESTYRLECPTYAVFNSKLLKDYFDLNRYTFAKSWYFEPILNRKLAQYLPADGEVLQKEKQILVYGRPSIDRNAFALVVETLKLWAASMPDAKDWKLCSAGEAHKDVDLGNGCVLRSLGKLSLEEYANTMRATHAGLSLMVSPHPSYPPLEMSTFGVKVVTNCYANKDLTGFNENMISLSDGSPRALSRALLDVTQAYRGQGSAATDTEYAKGGKPFGNAVEELANCLRHEFELD
ncbi:MAG: glycosyltransferase family 4 protein [Ruminococcaceae bacterium]|nr:glycosyltransferase family 4 protein [Oscillospiraceae bacterium]